VKKFIKKIVGKDPRVKHEDDKDKEVENDKDKIRG
jgi:hypothetical protein